MSTLILGELVANVSVVLVALAVGELVLRPCTSLVGARTQPPSIQRLGAAMLAGLGTCGLVGIPLAAMHLFRWEAFAVGGVVAVGLARAQLSPYARRLAGVPRRLRTAGPLVLACTGIAVIVGVANWLAALAPPVQDDELRYHLAEARSLAYTHSLHLALGHDQIYGNLPTLLETLYGEALTIDGVPLTHLVHLTLAASLIVLAAGVAKRLWGVRAAGLTVAALALYAEFIDISITGLIDSGEAAFEAGAVLLLALWAVEREDELAVGAALLIGYALATKYTALPMAALAAILVATICIRERAWRLATGLAGIAVVGCAYWYGKNLIRFGNPVYPLFLGHPHVSASDYDRFLRLVHAFGPRKMSAFLLVPSRFSNYANATAGLGMVIAPLALLARGSRRASALLLTYAAFYTTYWFWLGTHQTRFLMSAVVVTIVLASGAIGAARGPLGVLAVVVVAGTFVVGSRVHLQLFRTAPDTAVRSWLSTDKSGYALGIESTSAFLHHFFGCQVDAVAELDRRRLTGTVGLYELAPPLDFPRHNAVVPLRLDATTPAGVRAELAGDGFRFLLSPGRSPLGLSSNPAAKPVLAAAQPFWHRGGCWLLRLPTSASHPS
ncbi:MAG TPA: hypothetical protein VIG35_05385 [Gaiellaceae bacterium]